ncbi:hypothetical protein AZE42_13710, partial [Rhizopogon vesiculosus]
MRDSNWKKMVGIVTVQTVKTLIKKHAHAVKGVKDTKLPFDELNRSLDSNKIIAWKRDEKLAMEKRGEYLDMYQLKIDKAPTMAEIRLSLVELENPEAGRSGTVSWIIQGINLEDALDGLRLDIRRLPYDATVTQKVALQEKRQKLAARITKFHENADAMTEGLELDAGTVYIDDPRFCRAEGELDESSEVQHADDDDLGWIDDEIPAEDMGLWMPSL